MSWLRPPPDSPAVRRTALALLLVGCALRLVQWSGGASLWLDELMLAESLVSRDLPALLLDPLESSQVAPPLFLALEWVALQLAGDGDRALRLVPLVAALVTLPVFWWAARRMVTPVAALVALSLLALSPYAVSVAGIVKQYSTDLFATVATMAVVVALMDGPGAGARPLRAGVLAVLAGLLAWLSHPAVFVAAGALMAVWVPSSDDTAGPRSVPAGSLRRGSLAARGLATALWVALAAGAALWARLSMAPEVGRSMAEYWAGRFAPPFLEYPTWTLEHSLGNLLPRLLLTPYPGSGTSGSAAVDALPVVGMALALGLLGAGMLVARRRWSLLALTSLPVALTVVASRLSLYPLEQRAVAFLLPLGLILVGEGVAALRSGVVRVAPRRTAGAVTVGLVVLVVAPWVLSIGALPPPYRLQETRPLIRELARSRQPGEPVVVHHGARRAVERYGPAAGLGGDLIIGPDQGRTRDLLRILEALRGESGIWLVFGHFTGRDVDRDAALCYLRAVGRETRSDSVVGIWDDLPVSLHRFDLSDATLWDEADAETWPVDRDSYGRGGSCPPAPDPLSASRGTARAPAAVGGPPHRAG